MGGCKTYGGEENVPENALSRKFLDPSKRASGLLCPGVLYRKNRALTPERGGKRTVRGGGPKPLFVRGVIREVFHPPLFSTPPWRPLNRARTPPDNRQSLALSERSQPSQAIPQFHKEWVFVRMNASRAMRTATQRMYRL